MGLCSMKEIVGAFNCGGSLRQLGMPAWKGGSTDRYGSCARSAECDAWHQMRQSVTYPILYTGKL